VDRRGQARLAWSFSNQVAGMKDVGSPQQQIQHGGAQNVRGMQQREPGGRGRER
jgi:hypothetical protein